MENKEQSATKGLTIDFNKKYKQIEECDIVLAIESMCIESLPPDIFEKWEEVKKGLIKSRKNLNEEMFKNK